MRKLLILALLALVPDQISHAAPERLRGIGKDRENITAEELTSRSKSAADAQEFWVLRQSCTRKAPERILHGSYYPKIDAPLLGFGLDLRVVAAIQNSLRRFSRARLTKNPEFLGIRRRLASACQFFGRNVLAILTDSAQPLRGGV